MVSTWEMKTVPKPDMGFKFLSEGYISRPEAYMMALSYSSSYLFLKGQILPTPK